MNYEEWLRVIKIVSDGAKQDGTTLSRDQCCRLRRYFDANRRALCGDSPASPSSSEAASDDTRRLNLVADLLDGVRFAHDEDGDPHPVLDWFVGDGGGHVETTGKDWREAIDKMLLRLYGDVPKTASPSIGCPRCGKQGTSDELMGHTCKASPSSAGQEVR